MVNEKNTAKEWNKYWQKVQDSFLANLYRTIFLAKPVAKLIDLYFGKKGIFVEAGSGSSATSKYIKKRNRKIIAMDFSEKALILAKQQKNVDEVKLGDIKKMPFKKESLDGIWNLGVMEHFSKPEINEILQEFHRTLKKNGKIILLWPAKYNIVNNIMPWMFPAMPSELKSRKEGKSILKKNKFKSITTKVTVMGDIILVGKKI